MKKTLFILCMAFLSVCVYSAENCGVLVYAGDAAYNGKIKDGFCSGWTVESEASTICVYFKGGVEVRCAPGSVYIIKDAEKFSFELIRGSLFIKQYGDAKPAQIKTDGGEYKLVRGLLSLKAGKDAAVLYSGEAFENSVKLGITNAQKPSAWDSWNLGREKTDFCVKAEALDDYTQITQKIFTGIIQADVNGGKVLPAAFEDDAELVINFKAVRDRLVIASSGNVTAKLSGKVYGVLDADSRSLGEAKADYEKKEYQASVIQAADISLLYAAAYRQDVFLEGRTVFIDAGGFDTGGTTQLKQDLSDIPGVMEIKQKDMYSQKTVFELKCRCLAADMAEKLDGAIIAGKAIKVWKYSQNVVKLSFTEK